MTTMVKPDVDLADGNFYADGGAREAYRWMRANQPVFRDRNGLAAASTYQAVMGTCCGTTRACCRVRSRRCCAGRHRS
jgi:hypothetical protein